MDNLFISIIFGMLGGELANYLEKNNKKIEVPIRLVYLISLAVIYTLSVIFSAIVYLIKKHPIEWESIDISSTLISLSISIALFFIKFLKKTNKIFAKNLFINSYFIYDYVKLTIRK